ncbi:O-succinylbenzoate synthase, partial [Microbacterium sp. zg.Y909]|nr:O-succinylbenzoate synthase [Microbacterium sp. zg.Y909]
VKAQPLGGVHRALQLVAEAGLPAVVSSALDTSIGLSMGVALAAALPTLDFDCGLGTSALFVDDIATPALAPLGGALPVGRVQADAAALAAREAPADRRAWWLDRIARCYAVLDSVS